MKKLFTACKRMVKAGNVGNWCGGFTSHKYARAAVKTPCRKITAPSHFRVCVRAHTCACVYVHAHVHAWVWACVCAYVCVSDDNPSCHVLNSRVSWAGYPLEPQEFTCLHLPRARFIQHAAIPSFLNMSAELQANTLVIEPALFNM